MEARRLHVGKTPRALRHRTGALAGRIGIMAAAAGATERNAAGLVCCAVLSPPFGAEESRGAGASGAIGRGAEAVRDFHDAAAGSGPRTFTMKRALSPGWLLFILTGLNLFNYLDRFVLSA